MHLPCAPSTVPRSSARAPHGGTFLLVPLPLLHPCSNYRVFRSQNKRRGADTSPRTFLPFYRVWVWSKPGRGKGRSFQFISSSGCENYMAQGPWIIKMKQRFITVLPENFFRHDQSRYCACLRAGKAIGVLGWIGSCFIITPCTTYLINEDYICIIALNHHRNNPIL